MKPEETITTIFGGVSGVSPLGTHAFLDEFALAYHRAVAEHLRAEPEAVLERARRNLNRWTEGHSFGAGEHASLDEWREILRLANVDRLIEIMTDASDEGQRLRSSSPFVGVLSPEERLEILAAQINYEPYNSQFKSLLRAILNEGVDAPLKRYLDERNRTGKRLNEAQINQLGYALLERKKTAAAIKIFKLNIEDHPDSANTYDSLAETYLGLGETELAREFYKKALEVNPNYPNASTAAEVLKKIGSRRIGSSEPFTSATDVQSLSGQEIS